MVAKIKIIPLPGSSAPDSPLVMSKFKIVPMPGQQGPQGPQGEAGLDSTVEGPRGADSTVKGPQGVQGEQGLQGSVGATSTVAGPSGAAKLNVVNVAGVAASSPVYGGLSHVAAYSDLEYDCVTPGVIAITAAPGIQYIDMT
jgi:hypothetical protein